jgi:ectoine hydroxylase-related dioxygenase (phytanoyl-CoA dioxygenase family)
MNASEQAGDWRRQLKRDGYAHFRGLCPPALIAAARAAIDADLAADYDPARQLEYDHQSYCPALRQAPALMALLLESGAAAKLDEIVGWDRLGASNAQIALRRAHNARKAEPPDPHIDGLYSPHNGVPADVLVLNFTVLVGVYLSPTRQEFAGNFTVWPGSHHMLERHFRDHGPEALRNGMPQIPLGDPVQLKTEPGDVVLCHYQMAHTAAVNVSDHDRYAVYFRLWFKDIDERRWEYMTNIWGGWCI